MDETKSDNKNRKKLSIATSASDKIIPKLASRVLLSRNGTNTILTFILEMGNELPAQLVETIVIDETLHEGLAALLQEDMEKRKAET